MATTRSHKAIELRRRLEMGLDFFRPAPRLVVRCHLYSHGGYGQHAEALGRALEAIGVPIAYWPITVNEGHLPISDWARNRILSDEPTEQCVLLLTGPHDARMGPRPSVHFTMWESTILPAGAVENLNRAQAVIAPCRWVAEMFRANGVSTPIHVAPLGADADRFIPAPDRPVDRPFTVGLAARTCHGGQRKGVADAYRAFRAAFPIERFPHVRLVAKLFADCPTYQEHTGGDPRIEIITRTLTDAEMVRWYQGNDVLLDMTRGEGFGLNPLRSMACGVPVVGPKHTGLAEYLDETVGYVVEHTEEPASDFYEGAGHWYVPSVASAVARLTEAYQDAPGRIEKAAAALERAASFTWVRQAEIVRDVMVSVGALEDPRLPDTAHMRNVDVRPRHVEPQPRPAWLDCSHAKPLTGQPGCRDRWCAHFERVVCRLSDCPACPVPVHALK